MPSWACSTEHAIGDNALGPENMDIQMYAHHGVFAFSTDLTFGDISCFLSCYVTCQPFFPCYCGVT